MPFFKSTYNILKTPWEDEVFNENWMDSDKLYLPPKYDWDYSRQLKIEDVDIWEVIYEQGGGIGIYASWCPYAEFYMVRVGWELEMNGHGIETYYGKGAQKQVQKRMKQLNITFSTNDVWVREEEMWLYE
jgi:hypothetical protein